MDKGLKSEIKQAKAAAIYNTDYDMTLVAKFTFWSFIGFLGALVIMESLSIAFFPKPDGTPRFLTAEIIHSLFGYMGGWAQAIVTFLFGKKITDQFQKLNGKETSQKGTTP